jgi:hypothetical protein
VSSIDIIPGLRRQLAWPFLFQYSWRHFYQAVAVLEPVICVNHSSLLRARDALTLLSFGPFLAAAVGFLAFCLDLIKSSVTKKITSATLFAIVSQLTQGHLDSVFRCKVHVCKYCLMIFTTICKSTFNLIYIQKKEEAIIIIAQILKCTVFFYKIKILFTKPDFLFFLFFPWGGGSLLQNTQ